MRKIAEHIAGACRAGEPLVLVAVAESKDSTPRKAGTLMLVSADGLACGTIGGGAWHSLRAPFAGRQGAPFREHGP